MATTWRWLFQIRTRKDPNQLIGTHLLSSTTSRTFHNSIITRVLPILINLQLNNKKETETINTSFMKQSKERSRGSHANVIAVASSSEVLLMQLKQCTHNTWLTTTTGTVMQVVVAKQGQENKYKVQEAIKTSRSSIIPPKPPIIRISKFSNINPWSLQLIRALSKTGRNKNQLVHNLSKLPQISSCRGAK